MKTFNYLLAVLIAAISFSFLCMSPALAQANDWFSVAASDTKEYELSPASFETVRTTNVGGPGVSAVTRITDKQTTRITFNRLEVDVNSCVRGVGKLTVMDLSNKVVTQTDWITNGGNISSSIAEVMCKVLQLYVDKLPKS